MILEKNRTNTKIKIKEYRSKNEIIGLKDLGKTEKRILEPSSGGNGIRLNTPRTKFIRTIVEVIKTKFSDKRPC